MAATLRLSERSLAVVPGGSAVLSVEVANAGDGVEDVTVRVDGEAARWAEVDPGELVLFPGGEADVAVTFSVPEGPASPPGSVPFAVRLGGGGGGATAEAVLEVAPYAEATLALRPSVIVAGRRAEGTVLVENRGNVAATLQLSGSSDVAVVEVSPPEVVVPPGESVVATVRVVPDRGATPGGERLAFTVVAEGAEHPAVAVDGAVVVRAAARRPVLGAAAAAIALAALVLLLWFTAVRPLIRREARDSVAASGSAKAAGTPIDGRLFLTAGGTTSFTVPDGRTLQVTDIILQNPGGDSGVLRVRRGDQVLLEVGLENFRTQDVHFVTPLSFPGGQRLVLEAQCVATVGSAGGAPCTPSALFSALLR